MGGARINTRCETTVKNLYAAGEAEGGVHGANRLGGNALAETQVFGKIAGESAAQNALNTEFASNNDFVKAEEERINSLSKDGDHYPHEIKRELQKTMWNNVAIIRSEKGLKSAMARLCDIKKMLTNMKVPEGAGFNKDLQDALELQNMLLVASLTVESALLRHESRGSHYREDYPETSDKWAKSIVLNKNKDFRYIKRGSSTCGIDR